MALAHPVRTVRRTTRRVKRLVRLAQNPIVAGLVGSSAVTGSTASLMAHQSLAVVGVAVPAQLIGAALVVLAARRQAVLTLAAAAVPVLSAALATLA